MFPAALIMVAIGAFALAGAIFDWDWFMNHYKARIIVKLLTRTGARIFYGIFGCVIIILGLLFLFRFIEN